MYSAQSSVNEDPMQVWGALFVLSILFIFAASLFLPEVIYWTCLILHILWGIVDWGPFHSFAAPRYNLLAATGNNAANITFEQWVNVMEQTLGILHLFLVPLVMLSLWSWFRHPAQSRFTRRPLDLYNLPHAFADISPSLSSVLSDGDKAKLFHGQNHAVRRTALTPEAFVEKHHLISNMQLDVDACRQSFMAQLGSPLTTWKDMAPHEKALFAVFGLQFFLGDRSAAVGLMNALNNSCRIRSRRDKGHRSVPVWSLARSAFVRVIRSDGARQWLEQHRYVRSGLVWLYAHDLRLTPPNWLWLKGIDRTLFYALHRANTAKGFIEGAGVVAVARAENEALRHGLSCPAPCVEEAIEGLRRDLVSLGLIWDEPQPDRARRQRVRTNWSLTDDIFPRQSADTADEF